MTYYFKVVIDGAFPDDAVTAMCDGIQRAALGALSDLDLRGVAIGYSPLTSGTQVDGGGGGYDIEGGGAHIDLNRVQPAEAPGS